MQEEATQKTIAFAVKTTKLTAGVLKKLIKMYLDSQKQKANQPKHGKISIKELVGQNAGVSNIEVTDGNIKSFERVAKKYNVDFAIKKDKTTEPPRYLVFFKGRDADVLTQAFKEFVKVNEKKLSLCKETFSLEEDIVSMSSPNSFSLYISIPFCPSRCSYCSFVSFTSAKLLSLLDSYLERLCHDINETIDTINELGLQITTVYIGGGTPTTLNEKQLQILLDAITARIDPATLEEFTVEAGRPDTITYEKLHIIQAHGVTRVSINTQTLNDDVLELVGRKHTSADFYRAFEMARKADIKIINTDLIAGLPGEGFGSFSDTIDRIIELRPENLTFHTLCIKNAADFAQQKDHMKSMHMFSETSKCVDYSQLSAKNAGYIPYYIYRQKNTVNNLENVGFALPGTEGLYNVYMMEEIQTIFAVGAGAVSKMVSRDGKSIERIFEYKYPYEYLADPNGMKNKEKREKSIHFYRNIW